MFAALAQMPAPAQPGAFPPPAPPGGYPPPVAGTYPPTPAPKKGRGCIVATVVVVLLLCLCCVGSVLALSLFTKPRDLGVTFTEADYWSAVEKAGIDISGLDGGGDPAATEVVYEGSVPLDETFTSAEVSALISYSHMSGWPVHDTQIRFNEGGNVEISGYAKWRGVDYPFYVNADASVSGRTVSGSANEAEVFGIAVTPDMIAKGEPVALRILNDRLARLDGLDIGTAEIVGGELHLAGTVPARVSAVTP